MFGLILINRQQISVFQKIHGVAHRTKIPQIYGIIRKPGSTAQIRKNRQKSMARHLHARTRRFRRWQHF